MQYFRNQELAKLYKISRVTVFKWVEAARNGKLGLQLYNEGGKDYIANTVSNESIIEDLVRTRTKYRNSRAAKTVAPTARFYDVYSNEQVEDIIYSLEMYHELPFQYCYFDGGAGLWDEYAKRMAGESLPNTLNSTIELLESSLDSLDRLLAGRKRVNIVDLGVGNALPVKGLLAHLLKRGLLNRYIGVDISTDMLAVAERNLREWFGGQVPFEGHVRDITRDRFRDLIVKDYIGSEGGSTINLVLLLGGTLSNFRRPDDVLRVINTSMAANDVMLYSLKLDTPRSRRYFDFATSSAPQSLDSKLELMLDFLNIDDSLYTVKQVFDEDKQARFICIRLNVALSIKFKFESGERLVHFHKDDEILMWRAWHMSALDVVNQFGRNGFDLLVASQTRDHEFLLTASDIRLD